jgi:hypothetical protein
MTKSIFRVYQVFFYYINYLCTEEELPRVSSIDQLLALTLSS